MPQVQPSPIYRKVFRLVKQDIPIDSIMASALGHSEGYRQGLMADQRETACQVVLDFYQAWFFQLSSQLCMQQESPGWNETVFRHFKGFDRYNGFPPDFCEQIVKRMEQNFHSIMSCQI